MLSRLNVDARSHSLPAFASSGGAFFLPFPSSLLSLIQHQAQNIETELWVFQTHGLELVLGLVAQYMRSSGPESSNRFADGNIISRRVAVDESGISDFSDCC